MNPSHPHTRIRRTRTRLALAAGALVVALPGAAVAAPATTPSLPAQVAQYTTAAETALDRAASHFEAGRTGPGLAGLAQARGATAKADRAATALGRRATTAAQRVAAAKALAALGEHHDEAVEAALGMVGPAPAGAEGRVIAALTASVTGRERAVQGVVRMVPSLPPRAQAALGRAAADLVAGRADEAETAAEVLGGGEVSPAAASRVIGLIDSSLRGQQRAIVQLEAMRERLGERAPAGLDRAIASIGADRSRAGAALEGALESAPPAVRERVEGILGRVRPGGDDGGAPGGDGVPADVPTPSGERPGAPGEAPAAVETPSIPVEAPGVPVEIPAGPGEHPSAPVETPSIPVAPGPVG